MKAPARTRSAALLLLLPATSLLAANVPSLPELFQRAKAQVKAEAWPGALQTLDALSAEAAQPGNESAQQQLAAPIAFYRGVCEANLDRQQDAQAAFQAFLALQPNASMDPSMYSKKAIAAFQAARKKTSAPAEIDDKMSTFRLFQEFRLPPNSGEQVNAAWADGPVRWIMTAEEKRRWAELAGGGEWQDFVDHFWEARNPQPGNPDNIARTTFDRRVAFADAHLIQVEGTRGSMTDRGMVFVLLGPPTYAGRKPIRTGDDVNDAAGMSTVSSRATAYAQRALSSAGEPAGSSRSGA